MAKSAPAKAAQPPAAKAAPAKAETSTDTERKSVVPSKYAGKYKNGGDGPTAEFVKAQCAEKDGSFSFPALFQIARANGIADDKVSLYEQKIAANTNGAPGLTRMTLGNMLRAIARRDQKLKGINGKFVEVAEPALEVKGAAKAAQDKAK